jgi:hypothetical protein
MARPATLFGVEEDAADSRCVIESGAFLNESRRNAIAISARMPEQETIEFNQIAFRVVSTDRHPRGTKASCTSQTQAT